MTEQTLDADDLTPREGRRNRRLSPELRLAHIVKEATTLIAERGFNGVSLQAVAAACQMTVAGLLHHVKSKDGLLIAVLEHRDEVDLDTVGIRRGIAHPDARALLDRLIRRNAGQVEIVRLYTVLNSEALDTGHIAHQYFQRRYDDSIGIIADILRDEFPDPLTAASDLISIMDGIQLQWLRRPEAFDLVAAWARLADAYFTAHGRTHRAELGS
jgi:AcrR family transcriptional regulator